MLLRLIQADDLDLLSIFFLENNVDAITNSFTPFPLSRETAQWMTGTPHQDRFYLGLMDNEPLGFSMLRGWDEGFSIPSFGMFIDHRRHGLGLGKELLDRTIQAARELHCEKIRLSVFAGNGPACRIYLSRGFSEIERTPLIHNGIPDQKIIMVKDL